MSQLDTTDAPREWIRFSNETEFDSGHEASQAAVVDEAQWERFNRIAIRWVLGVAAVAGFLAVSSANGYSLGPGAGEQTVCEAAGGHMKDRVFVHRCAP